MGTPHLAAAQDTAWLPTEDRWLFVGGMAGAVEAAGCKHWSDMEGSKPRRHYTEGAEILAVHSVFGGTSLSVLEWKIAVEASAAGWQR